MKIFQKTCLLVSMMLFCGGIFGAKDSKKLQLERDRNKELKSISEAYRKVFRQESLFAKKNENTKTWQKMIEELGQYVNKNSGGNKKLLKAFNTSELAGDTLINTLGEVYDSIFTEEVPSPIQSWHIWEEANSKVGRVKQSQNNLVNMSNILKNTHFYLVSAQKKDNVKKVLLRLMDILEIVQNQLIDEFKERYDIASKKYEASLVEGLVAVD